jgi:plastocyanin
VRPVGIHCATIAAALVATVVVLLSGPTNAIAQGASQVHTVIIGNFKFSPEVLSVKPGDRIVWVNQDIVPHTATALDKSWDTGAIGSNERKEMVIKKAQTLSYYCFYHPGMTAKLLLE